MKPSTVAHIRAYVGLLTRTTRQNPATPSRLAHEVSEADYKQVSEDMLISEAKNILRATKLTAFVVATRAEAVAVIRGLSHGRRP